MSLPEVRELSFMDFQYMAAYCVKHPSGARAEAFYMGRLLETLINKDINREQFPEGISAQELVPWLNQEIPDNLLSAKELQEKEDKINQAMAKQLLEDFD